MVFICVVYKIVVGGLEIIKLVVKLRVVKLDICLESLFVLDQFNLVLSELFSHVFEILLDGQTRGIHLVHSFQIGICPLGQKIHIPFRIVS